MNNNQLPVAFFPDGRPVPVLLTESELIVLLRLDTVGISCPSETIKRYRDSGLLRATQISRKLFYKLDEILAFLDRQTEEVQR